MQDLSSLTRIKLVPPAVEALSLNHVPPGNSPQVVLNISETWPAREIKALGLSSDRCGHKHWFLHRLCNLGYTLHPFWASIFSSRKWTEKEDTVCVAKRIQSGPTWDSLRDSAWRALLRAQWANLFSPAVPTCALDVYPNQTAPGQTPTGGCLHTRHLSSLPNGPRPWDICTFKKKIS